MEVIGSKTPIVILSYRNCELYCCHLDGYQTNTEALLHRLAEIETVFLSRPHGAKFRIWYNLDENRLDRQTMQLIAESLLRIQSHIYKIALIGLRRFAAWKFDHIVSDLLGEAVLCKAYFTDAEIAKGWLI